MLLAASVTATADEYAAARAELVAAYQAQDYPAMVVAAGKALAARPNHPGAGFNLALAHALAGNHAAALDVLEDLLASGIDFGIEGMDEFAGVREAPGWDAFLERVEVLRAPTGSAETALALPYGQFVPEGIAVDASGSIYLGSIRKGLLVRGDEVLSDRQGHWSVFGMRFHEDGSLWFASAAVPQLEEVGDDLGKTGLFRLDVATGDITHAALLPQLAEEQVLGDLIIDGNSIYTTDSLTGGVYRYDIATDAFTTLLAPGLLRSPQGLVLDAAGEYLYVANYSDGLYRVSVTNGEAVRVPVSDAATDYGIDGLYRYGKRLIAIQNGIRPHRVTAFDLSDDGTRIVGSQVLAANLPAFDEPTLGALHGDSLYFVANSHWNRFDRDNGLPEGLSGPIVLKLDLDHE